MDAVDCIVIGAGVIGLAAARALAMRGREVVVLEAGETFGTGISSRSSEIIHAGIYYPRGSLKAQWCMNGCTRIFEYCETHGIDHRRCGKLIVATSEDQLADLRAIHSAAAGNGVELRWLDRTTTRAREPAVKCEAALHSRHTGILDSRAYMRALLGDAQEYGAQVAFNSRVARMWLEHSAVLAAVNDDSRPGIRARVVVNCAGLHAVHIARCIEDFPQQHIPKQYFARGHYFALTGRSPFSHLIYPIPEPAGLGVHLTLDLAGRARFGPDVEWVEELDYGVDVTRSARFYDAIRRFWPDLEDGQLVPAYAGIRPKIAGPGQPPADFRIDGPAQHGVNGIINLFGIESPGLTASLPIADHVAQLITA